jgi:hypothetical protein
MITENEQYHYPLDGEWPVSQTFAEHLERAKQYAPGCYNGGIDYACPVGTPVLATLEGKVIKAADETTGYGMHIKLDHGDINGVRVESIYGHLSEMLLNVGAWVHSGWQIGTSGNTGNSTGPHLHFEVRHDGIPVDPMPLLQQRETTAETPPDDQYNATVVALCGGTLRRLPEISDNVIAYLPAGTRLVVEQAVLLHGDNDLNWIPVICYMAEADSDGTQILRLDDE